MSLQFVPPNNAIIQEYLNRKTPYEEAAIGVQTALQNYLALDESKRRNITQQREWDQRDAALGMRQAEMGGEAGVPYDPNNPAPWIEARFKARQQAQEAPRDQTFYDPQTGKPQYTIPAGGKLIPQSPMQFIGTQNGKPVLLNPKTGATQTGSLPGQGPLMSTTQTEGQANASLYADRMQEANKQLADIYKGGDFSSIATGAERMAPNLLKSDRVQVAEQAERNFLNAVLRRESGAVISPSEFREGKKQYFEVTGDSDAVKRQKALNRQTAVEGLFNAAGRPLPQSSGFTPDKKARLEELRRKKAEGTLR